MMGLLYVLVERQLLVDWSQSHRGLVHDFFECRHDVPATDKFV